jgi:predicted aconitase with swiveling domain
LKIQVLRGRPIVSGRGKGTALVSAKPVSFLGGVDPKTGEIIERDHNLRGENVGGKVLCFPHGHGSTVGSYVLYSLAKRGLGPRAIVNEEADPVVVVGAIIANIPMVDRVDICLIENGDEVEVDGEKGIVTIFRIK